MLLGAIFKADLPGKGRLSNMVDCVATSSLNRLIVGHMRGVNHPGKLRLCRWMLKALNKDTIEMRLGNENTIFVPFDDYIGHAILMEGSYEPLTLALADRLLGVGGVFVDVGANFGLFSAFLARRPDVDVVAIEPDPLNFLRLTRNCANVSSTRCRLVNGLAGADYEVLPIREPVPGNRGTVQVAERPQNSRSIAHYSLAARVQELLEHFELDRVDLMKIDVEGYEKEVLAGCSFDGPTRPGNVIIEYSDQGLRFKSGWSRADIVEFFTRKGYEFLTINGEPGERLETLPEDNAWFRDIG